MSNLNTEERNALKELATQGALSQWEFMYNGDPKKGTEGGPLDISEIPQGEPLEYLSVMTGLGIISAFEWNEEDVILVCEEYPALRQSFVAVRTPAFEPLRVFSLNGGSNEDRGQCYEKLRELLVCHFRQLGGKVHVTSNLPDVGNK